ncbi:conserved hypothetical protein [Culex quinquefasciatus]|uniref:Odorant receptor n=1 Tax=Culex quinquefasciatus TaxID=7176 RepID=B0WGW8_CULQU|nr:conserved hypothetical protein [Culex quinquefasciatus]|eukprot:XP_001847952.1 conserved hypothetical protein [Culex quinquefasciatus]
MEYIRKLSQLKVFQHSFKEPSEFYASVLVVPNRVAGVSVGVSLQASMKIFTHLYYRQDLLWIQEYTKKLYQEECINHKKVLMDFVTMLHVLMKVVVVCYAITASSMIVGPFMLTLLSGQKLLTFGFWIPYIDRNSWFGYGCNFTLQLILSLFITCEYMGLDIIYFMTMLSSVNQIDLLIIKIKNIGTQIEQTDAKLQESLMEIVKRHEEHLKFVRTVENMYRGYFFVLYATLGFTIVLVLYAIVTLSWIAGYGSGIFITYQLFIFCLVPTVLEIKKEELQREIYNISWYEWSRQNRKSLQLMLQTAQQPNCLSLIFCPLDMPTFVEAMRIIYTILTLLLTFRSGGNSRENVSLQVSGGMGKFGKRKHD